MKYPDRKILFTLLSASALLIAGCGGGGGGGSSSDDGTASNNEPLAISSSNGETVARATATGASSVGQSGAELTQAQIVGAADIDDGGLTGMSVAEATQFAILEARDQANAATDVVTGATTSYACDSGSATIVDNGGTEGVLEEGDNWTATWDNCEFNFTDPNTGTTSSFLLDGQVEFSVPTCTNCNNADDDSADWEYGVEITYTDWLIRFTQDGTTTVDILFDGTLSLSAVNSAGATTFTVAGGPFSINDNLNGTSFEYASLDLEHVVNTTGAYTTTVTEIALTSNNLNGQVTASTVPGEPFEGNGSYPTSGTLQINGANGSSAIVYAGDCSASEFRLVVNGVDEGCKGWATGQ